MTDDARTLRWDPRLVGDDVCHGARRAGSSIVDLVFVIRVYRRRVTVHPTAAVYEPPARPRCERASLPYSLAKGGDDVWHLERCWLSDAVPVGSYLLVGVPRGLGDDWSTAALTREPR